jgi:hypothetical protein
MSIESGWLNIGTFARIQRYIEGGPYYIGLGGTAEWLVEGSPPAVNPTLTQQTGLFGYVRVQDVRAVMPATFLEPGGYLLGNTFWNPISEPQDINQSPAQHCLFAGLLYHQDLPVSNFRTLGLYLDSTFTGGDRFIAASTQGLGPCSYLQNRPPVLKKPNVIQRIGIVMQVSSLGFAAPNYVAAGTFVGVGN